MQRRGHRGVRFAPDEHECGRTCFTYRPLSSLPTPPPALAADARSPVDQPLGDGETLCPQFRGPAIHLVNLIPACASLASASVPLVQAMLSRAGLPVETVALAVCILDSLDAEFARAWRLACPPGVDGLASSSSSAAAAPPPPHIDHVRPELIILAALVLAAKFTQDRQQPPRFYRVAWGRAAWSSEQLNATERCILESLAYRILPLCDDGCLTDAMVDMQLAARLEQSASACWDLLPLEPTPPDSVAGSECEFVPSHARSKTALPVAGLGFSLAPAAAPAAARK